MNLHADIVLLVTCKFRLDRFAAAYEGVQRDTNSCQSVGLSFTYRNMAEVDLLVFLFDQRKGFYNEVPACHTRLGQSEHELTSVSRSWHALRRLARWACLSTRIRKGYLSWLSALLLQEGHLLNKLPFQLNLICHLSIAVLQAWYQDCFSCDKGSAREG